MLTLFSILFCFFGLLKKETIHNIIAIKAVETSQVLATWNWVALAVSSLLPNLTVYLPIMLIKYKHYKRDYVCPFWSIKQVALSMFDVYFKNNQCELKRGNTITMCIDHTQQQMGNLALSISFAVGLNGSLMDTLCFQSLDEWEITEFSHQLLKQWWYLFIIMLLSMDCIWSYGW